MIISFLSTARAGFVYVGSIRRKIRLVESNAKSRYLKKLKNCDRCLGGVYLSEALSPPRFLLGYFVGSESSQKLSVKLLQNMVSNTTPHPHPLPATHWLYILYFDFGKGGMGEMNQRRLERQ
jgi:hypothetical protein